MVEIAYRKAAVGIPGNGPRTSRTSRFGVDIKKRASWFLYFLPESEIISLRRELKAAALLILLKILKTISRSRSG